MAPNEYRGTDEILASTDTEHVATLIPADPEYGPYRYHEDVVAMHETIKAVPSYQGPPVTLGQTLVFDVARPDFWDNLSVNEQFRMKKKYLEANYTRKLLWFEEDGVFAAPWVRVYIYKNDYFARFEVVDHPNEAVQFDTSMSLLNHLCRNEKAIPDDYDAALCTTLKARLENQIKVYFDHVERFRKLRAAAPHANREKVAIPRLPAKPTARAAIVAPAPVVIPIRSVSSAPDSTFGEPRTLTPRPMVLPIRDTAVAATDGGGGRKPPKKFAQVQHRDAVTSASTVATTNHYKEMTSSGTRRRMCDWYGSMGYDEALKRGRVLQYKWKLADW